LGITRRAAETHRAGGRAQRRRPAGGLRLHSRQRALAHLANRAKQRLVAVGLLAHGHIVAGDFHHIGKEASTRWADGPDPSMLAEAGALDSADETCREYERVVNAKYLDHIRTEAKQFSNKLLSRRSGVARCAIMNFKKGKNTIKPRTLRKLTKAIHELQNKKSRRGCDYW
jgi:hypothetical protein